MTCSVILKSFNRPWLLGVCLESIRECLGPDGQVIVADDGTLPDLWAEARRRYGHLATDWIHSEAGEAKWTLCREGRFAEVVPTCGETWNRAHAAVQADVIFLIEDDSYLTRRVSAVACAWALRAVPETLCLIGLAERCAMEDGTGPVGHGPGSGNAWIEGRDLGWSEHFRMLRHAVWPWSFDGIFYRRADWDRIGPWPEGVATGPMEGFVQRRLAELGWMDRSYGVAAAHAGIGGPFCRFDWQTSCRTDHPSTYAGRFRHVDACNAAWLSGEFVPTYRDVRMGRWPSDRLRSSDGMQLHYPRALRQINYVTGHELCGELAGEAADARWLSQANAEAARYGEAPWEAVPPECRSA